MSGARRVEDLEAYQLAVQLRRRILRLTKREPAASDFKFVGQIRDAARGGTRNISEGFSRFAPNEFRQYLNYAWSSLSEVKDELADAFDSEYVTEAEHGEILAVLERTNGAIARLMEYPGIGDRATVLRRTPQAPPPARVGKNRRASDRDNGHG